MNYNLGVQVGPISPLNADEMKELSVDELVTKLKEWTADSGFMTPGREGLALELSNLVAASPDQYAKEAMSFMNLHPAYVRNLIGGLESAARSKRAFDWQPVLGLCSWVIDQIDPEPGDEAPGVPSWGWESARREVTRLLETGFRPGAQELPPSARRQVWEILSRLAKDFDPTPERETEYLKSSSSPYGLAINSIRGAALSTAIEYGLWVRKHLAQPPLNFNGMPELRSLLEERLKVSVEPSLAVHSIFGRMLPWIHFLNAEWTTEHLDHIFPDDRKLTERRNAAWSAYILYSQLYDNIFPMLENVYRQAVFELDRDDEGEVQDANKRLAGHLILLYLWGQVDLRNSLLSDFFGRAPEAIRGHAIGFAGQVLKDNNDLEEEFIGRAKLLWEDRTADLDLAATERQGELAAFGRWFAATSLDAGWRIQQLKHVLSRTMVGESDYLIFKQFLVLLPDYPLDVLSFVREMIENSDISKVYFWRQDLWEILELASENESADVLSEATKIISLLAARGETEYLVLIDASV